MLQNRWVQIGLIGGAIVFAITQYWPYLSGQKSTPAPAVAARPSPQTKTPPAKPAAKSKLPMKTLVKDRQRMLALARHKDWKRNPFCSVTKREKETPQVPTTKINAQHTLHIESILITEHQRLAVINQRLVKVGDIIQGKTVVQIDKDYIVLDDKGVRQDLRLANSRLPMKIYTVKAEEYK